MTVDLPVSIEESGIEPGVTRPMFIPRPDDTGVSHGTRGRYLLLSLRNISVLPGYTCLH